MNNIFDEEELRSLFSNGQTKPDTSTIQPKIFANKPDSSQASENIPPQNLPPGRTIEQSRLKNFFTRLGKMSWKFAIIFVAIFILTFILINYSAISKQFGFFYHNSFSEATPMPAPPSPIFDPMAPATLSVPKINVSAPIIWNVPEDNFTNQLLNGVVQFQGTALPGQNGNVFIFGHSSYYQWATSPYKDVFALLDKLAVGDLIYIQYNQATYTYKVNGTKVVSPKNLEVLGSSPMPILTLMTCVPVGTNLNRLIVTADQINVSGQF